MGTKLFLYGFFTLVYLKNGFADVIDDSVIQSFLEATPIHPTINTPDVPVPTMDEVKIEVLSNSTANDGFSAYAECSTNRTDLKAYDTGEITTPNYPRNYPARTSCEWILESPPDTRIEATIFDLYTQPWFFTYFDYIMISKDGDFSETDRMAGDMNAKTPMTIISNSNKLGIRFRSSTLFNFRGMKLEYLVRPTDENIQRLEPTPYDGVCGQSFILDEDNNNPSAPSVIPPTSPILNPGGSTTPSTAQKTDLDDWIIASGNSPPHSYPWMAALLIDGRSFCGGSIIDDQHILTAAHCTDGSKRITVLLGAHDIKMKEENRLLFNVSRDGIFQHPDYNPNTISHDVSILRLPEKIQFTKEITPICLPNRYATSKTYVGEQVKVSGWGKPADSASGISPILKNTTVSVMSNGQCRTFFRSLVTGNLICVATKTTSSPCRGDSGGPLILKQQNQAGKAFFMQVGIVSFGGNSCERGLPVGFTRVTAFMGFISKITGRGH